MNVCCINVRINTCMHEHKCIYIIYIVCICDYLVWLEVEGRRSALTFLQDFEEDICCNFSLRIKVPHSSSLFENLTVGEMMVAAAGAGAAAYGKGSHCLMSTNQGEGCG